MEQQCAVNSTLARRPMACQDMFLRLYQPKLLSAVLQSSLYGNSKLHPLGVEELTIEHSGQSRPVELFHYWWICSNCHWPTNMHCTWCCMAHWCSSIHIFTLLLDDYADVFEGLGELPIITPSLIEHCEQSLMSRQPSPAPILRRSSRAKTLPVRLTDYVLTRTC